MIKINHQVVEPEELMKGKSKKSEEYTIIKQMAASHASFEYQTMNQLTFELLFRVNTMKAARELNKSGAHFTTFSYAFCNKKYWDRLANGGFLIKAGVPPSVAIQDILKNGKLYAFECSTAIAIVLYIAALYSIGSERFDILFARLYLMDWQFDDDLPIHQTFGDDYLPGDVLHFNNPDFDPQQPHWRAENVIFFGDDQYYGHGVGIRNASTIINFLNKKRKPDSKTSAYLMQMITRPRYQSLFYNL
ncbi:protein-glutamine gamma-glutamyltransferase [Neobacillus sp. MM2021_6]|uniref:protein-glutamine gamma-glutamyltransferase n=1 Tax=Bacillaceae TaxID=186817 RepID=UPI00140CF5DA|nr:MULTISPECIES: protein-glutamine gamma-glutamyltransferase [Bacillaceae]MBO0961117.1 protein-glutamine gamma-glutamyltransferase [Neobacillus sp. MM2021_6]NHC21124.1 protein-glutamine gamma-glutamyltransferase [Bacillus sp. MM2020_4]WML39442.1 protein-glutamine gamma-glutamyltransferase [Neobacillus sp. OS1-2]